MKRVFKILYSGTGDEFFVTSSKKPKIKNLIELCAEQFCKSEDSILDDVIIDEIEIIDLE